MASHFHYRLHPLAGAVTVLSFFSCLQAAPKVLLVVAHPDDEYYCAASIYRVARELGGTVDQVIITNGEAGFRYSYLAAKYYHQDLTNEKVGRARLPEIRKQEVRRAGEILGVRKHYFLGEKDQRFTLDAGEVIERTWDSKRVRGELRRILEKESYDFIWTVLPREDTHGHHQAATILALDVAGSLPAARRPVVLAAEPGRKTEPPPPFSERPGFHSTRVAPDASPLTFDRSRTFGFKDALSYSIVVNWVIAEHKSQGMFQNDAGRHDCERFWLFAQNPSQASQHAAALFSLLNASPSSK